MGAALGGFGKIGWTCISITESAYSPGAIAARTVGGAREAGR